ncbi:polysaccharide biosynthesis tyrosine autokinase [Curtobacterium sp. MCLR17_007]|uniref:polysaccharide biosynthesis tyrosine autokinase n=1 Tax=Curtobacterium sp. MCLR17_007 TaxID=2175648 RepID=UPI0015E88EF3|nr:polysaccharide biosynthesis tyrosine autokinase [Curtobacterium sp. MCLR17_007]WIB60690.1 polysaccharide biosynthesis tyrosine autokinase [Curtobacterium sp. MCLR17_007]
MTFLDMLQTCRRAWVLILLFVTGGLAGGVAATVLVDPLYRAEAELFISVRAAGDDASEVVQGNSAAQQKVTSYLEVIRSATVLQPVIDQLHLDTDVAELADRLTALSPANSVLVDLSVLDQDPATAKRIAAATAESFATVVTAKLERPMDGGPSLVGVQTIQPPTLPTEPDSPNLVKNIALGLVSGVALGIAAALLKQAMDTRIRSRADIEAITSSPVLGDITFDPTAKAQPLVVHDDPRNPRAEAFRTLRTNVQFVELDDAKRTFTVTSAMPSEGKSTTAANLALTLAAAGGRVALVDADLRRPRIAEMVGIEGSVGLTDLLIGRAELEDVLVPWGRGGLHVLPAGSIPPNPSELLASEAMRRLVESLIDDHDAVVIDAPPVLPVTDAAILSRLTGGALLIVAAGRTSRPQLRAAIATLENVGTRALGVVMTMRRTKKHEGSSSYYVYAEESDAPAPAARPGRRAVPDLDA